MPKFLIPYGAIEESLSFGYYIVESETAEDAAKKLIEGGEGISKTIIREDYMGTSKEVTSEECYEVTFFKENTKPTFENINFDHAQYMELLETKVKPYFDQAQELLYEE